MLFIIVAPPPYPLHDPKYASSSSRRQGVPFLRILNRTRKGGGYINNTHNKTSLCLLSHCLLLVFLSPCEEYLSIHGGWPTFLEEWNSFSRSSWWLYAGPFLRGTGVYNQPQRVPHNGPFLVAVAYCASVCLLVLLVLLQRLTLQEQQ